MLHPFRESLKDPLRVSAAVLTPRLARSLLALLDPWLRTDWHRVRRAGIDDVGAWPAATDSQPKHRCGWHGVSSVGTIPGDALR